MPFSSRYTPEQKTAYKVFYFCLSIVVVGTVILVTSLRYSENNVVKEIVGIILVILGASLCYFMCLQIRRSAMQVPKTPDTQSYSSQCDVTEQQQQQQQQEMAFVIVEDSGKLVLQPVSGNVPFNERSTGEPPLLIISPPTREASNVNCQNFVSSSSDSVALPWPLSMNRRRQLAQMSPHIREANRITSNCLPTTHQTRRNLPPEPPPYSSVGTRDASPQSSSGQSPPLGSPPPYEDAVRNVSAASCTS